MIILELEKDIETYLKNKVEKAGGLCYKFESPGQSGVPDRVVILNRTVFVEVKRKNGKPRKLQELQIKKMVVAGAEVFVIDGKSKVDDLIKELVRSGQV